MSEALRRADVTWTGDLLSGSGTINSVTSGTINAMPVSWRSRTEDPDGRTSPEELLAAAHASCFSMQFSSFLAKAGSPPERLEVSAEVSFTKQEVGWKVTRSHLTVRATVPGISEEDFLRHAEAAKEGCPISGAIQGNVELTLDATLAS